MCRVLYRYERRVPASSGFNENTPKPEKMVDQANNKRWEEASAGGGEKGKRPILKCRNQADSYKWKKDAWEIYLVPSKVTLVRSTKATGTLASLKKAASSFQFRHTLAWDELCRVCGGRYCSHPLKTEKMAFLADSELAFPAQRVGWTTATPQHCKCSCLCGRNRET